MLPRTVAVALLVTSCALACTPASSSRPPEEPTRPAPADDREPHLVQLGQRWYITDLDPISTQIVSRSSLFAAVDPQQGRVAVLKVLGRGTADSHRIEVVPVCRSFKVPQPSDLVGLGVEPLSPTGDAQVDQCLVRVVDESSPDNPQQFVVLDVGGGEQIKPGDEYALLGDPVCQDGFVPLGLDTARDGRCQIAPSDGPVKNISRCDIVKRPPGEGTLKNRYALFIPRQ
ncbi:MAG: hypothetical protein AB1Z98_32350 [Nannocystaceae bacterium]